MLRAELEVFRSSTFDERAAQLAEDNKRLKRRNGELQIELLDVKDELKDLKKKYAHLPNDASAEQQAVLMGMGMGAPDLAKRPQTAAVRSKPLVQQWLDDPAFDPAKEQEAIDKELAEMMQRNQARLAELHSDLK